MTAKTLEQEAREAAAHTTAMDYAESLIRDGASPVQAVNDAAEWELGYIAGLDARDAEIATLRARVAELIDAANVLLGNDEYDMDWPQYQARVREAIKAFEIPLPETKVNASQQGA